jgi:hypothetical protein
MEEKWFERTLIVLGIVGLLVLFYASVANAAGTVCQIGNGCTGTSTAPSYGQVLVGNSSGAYNLTATSSLGFPTGGSGTVTSVGLSSPNSTLTTGGTNPVTGSGTINLDINLGNSNQWTASTTFTKVVNLANASTSIETAGLVYNTGITSALDLFNSSHQQTAFGGSNCSSHQYANSISAAGAFSCAQITLTTDVTGILPIANGGTNATSLTTGYLLYFNGTSIAATSSPLTFGNFIASTTVASNFIEGELGIATTTTQLSQFGISGMNVGTSTIVSGGQLVNTVASSTCATACTINWNNGNQQVFLLNGPAQFNLTGTTSNAVNGAYYSIYIQQDSVGSRAVTWDAQNIRWANGTTTISSAANSCTLIGFHYLSSVPNGQQTGGIYLAIASSTATTCI